MVFEKIQDLPQELKTIIFSFLHVNIRLELLLDSFYPSFKIDVLNEEVKATKRDFGENFRHLRSFGFIKRNM